MIIHLDWWCSDASVKISTNNVCKKMKKMILISECLVGHCISNGSMNERTNESNKIDWYPSQIELCNVSISVEDLLKMFFWQRAPSIILNEKWPYSCSCTTDECNVAPTNFFSAVSAVSSPTSHHWMAAMMELSRIISLQRIRCSERFIDTLSFRWALNLCEYKYTMRSKQKRCAKKVNSILIISIVPNGQSFKHMRWTCWTMNEKWIILLLQTIWNRNEVANIERKNRCGDRSTHYYFASRTSSLFLICYWQGVRRNWLPPPP